MLGKETLKVNSTFELDTPLHSRSLTPYPSQPPSSLPPLSTHTHLGIELQAFPKAQRKTPAFCYAAQFFHWRRLLMVSTAAIPNILSSLCYRFHTPQWQLCEFQLSEYNTQSNTGAKDKFQSQHDHIKGRWFPPNHPFKQHLTSASPIQHLPWHKLLLSSQLKIRWDTWSKVVRVNVKEPRLLRTFNDKESRWYIYVETYWLQKHLTFTTLPLQAGVLDLP